MVVSFFRQLQKRDRDFSVEIGGEVLPVKVIENDRAKRMTLRLFPAGDGLKVTIPGHVDDREIRDFVERNRNWAAARISRMPERIELRPGTKIPFMGVEHQIVLSGKLRGVVKPTTIHGQPVLQVPGDEEAVSRKLVAFFKKEARRELDKAVSLHSARIGVRAKQIRITDTTSRWGSCSSTRTLSFSWRIILAPPEVLNYLAAHEVAHLQEMNHSDRFWNLTRELCPDTDIQKSWLRSHGNRLHAISV